MSKRNLFIVTDDGIFLGRGSRHKELAKRLGIEERFLLGGGVFDQRSKDDTFILFGESFDFGKCDKDFLEMFIGEDKVHWFKSKLGKTRGGESVRFEVDEIREEKDSDQF